MFFLPSFGWFGVFVMKSQPKGRLKMARLNGIESDDNVNHVNIVTYEELTESK